ncbi:M48 family metalloprotease [Candidatus Poribacteria bacterium]|nr:M48 family metalloprotease [Candidatus Poribacteria bacterium]
MKKKIRRLFPVCLMLLTLSGCSMLPKMASKEGLRGTVGMVQAQTLSDDAVIRTGKDAAGYRDTVYAVVPLESEHGQRLARLTEAHRNEDNLTLNFSVYSHAQPNVISFSDGSIRVSDSLMALMDDNELLFVIAHEIGHVKHLHSKEALKTAYRASAARNLTAAQGGTVGNLAKSDAGAWAEEAINTRFSQGDEDEADEYARMFMGKHGYPVESADSALDKVSTFCAHNPRASAVMASQHAASRQPAGGLSLSPSFRKFG